MKDDSLILKASGIDAGTFLQGELTCDMNVLAEGRWTYAACCNPHGKVLAVLWVFPWTDGVLLRLPRSATPAFLAQTRENIDGREVQITETPLHFGALAGDNPATEQHLIATDGKTLIGGVPGVIPFISEQPQADALPAEAWYAARIRAGIPEIYADSAGRLLPQALNLKALGGFSRDKHSYIGHDALTQQKNHRYLAIASVPVLASGQHTLYDAKEKSVGILLDYGHAAGETLVQAVIEDHQLGKPLHLADDDQTLIFKAVAAK